jgi:3-deoxy-D-manno-octulosonic-acid transferase
MSILLDLGTCLYHLGVRIAAPFVPKARQWRAGREGLWERLEARREALQGCLWMHCASMGEFEQGRPVLEAIKRERPELPVLLTFFSPSGYEARKGLGSTAPGSLVTHVEYLPPDSATNAKRLLDLVRPRTVLWVKYEFWPQHLAALRQRGIPVHLVSGIFRPGQPFFKWYGAAWRSMLGCFTELFVQDEASRALLAGIGLRNVTVSGDTRFDRVHAIVKADEAFHLAAAFRGEGPVLVCGSTWPADEMVLLECVKLMGRAPKLLVVPHELDTPHLRTIEQRFPKPLARWSEVEHSPVDSVRHTLGEASIATLLVDRMGLLARLYRHGDVAYVGGGFGDGIHNLLEPAAWGLPVIFGPQHGKFAEAKGLIDAGGGFCVHDAEELAGVLKRLLNDAGARRNAGEAAARYVRERSGATRRIVPDVLMAL